MHAITRLVVSFLLLIVVSAHVHAQTGDVSLPAAEPQKTVEVYLFWSPTCPHCARARRFLERTIPAIPGARLHAYELNGDAHTEQAFVALSLRYKNDPPAIPLVVIADEAFVGYADDETTGREMERRIRQCLMEPCRDPVPELLAQATGKHRGDLQQHSSSDARLVRPAMPEEIYVPGWGSIETKTLSLPVLTLVLGAVDGFNPCAMWVLVFLIGLLLGLKDRARMWAYGGAFLLTSGAVYLAFMAAWLNVFLLIGSLHWIRWGVGAFAVIAGGYYLREFVRNPEAVCKVASPGEKQHIMDRLRATVTERSFVLAIIGIMALAIAVNMIELLCSAGIPAVYTQVLALSDLSASAYFGYLALYIAVFMLDDALIFVAAMLTLKTTGLAGSYARWSHLIGGLVLLVVGALLIFRPQWLAIA